jgi:hypothetical protein
MLKRSPELAARSGGYERSALYGIQRGDVDRKGHHGCFNGSYAYPQRRSCEVVVFAWKYSKRGGSPSALAYRRLVWNSGGWSGGHVSFLVFEYVEQKSE